MRIVSTTGYWIEGEQRKAYRVTTSEGDIYDCTPSGSAGYQVLGKHYPAIKQIKSIILSGGIVLKTQDEVIDLERNELGTWDCVDPCALLILNVPHDHGLHGSISPQLIQTLDAYGWLDEEGRPDVKRAEKEITRVENLIANKE